MKVFFQLFLLLLFFVKNSFSQGSPPWEHPLLSCTSNDGITFSQPVMFQDSSGVPCLMRWKGDTLISVFQWFREPIGAATWDRVAVKFSYDDGFSWTSPIPITINNFPPTFQRPFDPTLVRFANDSLRLYYSSSNGMGPSSDSLINTYSAKSIDGINFEFEPGARADHPTNRLIDPAVAFFNHAWHYLSPAGAPQDGAFHFISQNGVQFNPVQNIQSDSMHNWTGNYMIQDSTEMRFYGCGGSTIWYNATPNGGVWNGYVHTNIQGGDPSVVRKLNGTYLMIYTGGNPPTDIKQYATNPFIFQVYPNPASSQITLCAPEQISSTTTRFDLLDITGRPILSGEFTKKINLNTELIPAGCYYIIFTTENTLSRTPLIIAK
ncbi:MAG: T9SS type A sorting domain-containing protein [Bacteroidetes bacterium]|nr:T9SS type A sorting domain-containing protein [Bacteroidota bacterium]